MTETYDPKFEAQCMLHTSKVGGLFLLVSIKYQRGSKKNEESREAKKKCVKIPHYGGNMFVNVNMNNLTVKNYP